MFATTAAPGIRDKIRRALPPIDLELFPGVYWDHGDGTGIYRGRDGRTHECNHQEASELARREMIILTYRSSGEYAM